MNSALAKIYAETLHAQAGMQQMADIAAHRVPEPAAWNEIEEALEAALDQFRAYRRSYVSDSLLKAASPGLAGACEARTTPPAPSGHLTVVSS